MKIRIPYVCVSHIGNRRETNQDNYICGHRYRESGQEETKVALSGCIDSREPAVLGVFDGMGGEEHGETASLLAAQEASGLTVKRDPREALSAFCRAANGKICAYAEEHQYRSMGTTAAVAAFGKRDITLCNIGDSKIFSFDEGDLVQLSHDHLAAAPYGLKRPLSQCLGIPPSEMTIEPYIVSRPYRNGELFLICSDGLTDMVPDEEISGILQAAAAMPDPAGKKLDAAADELLSRALEQGGRDNITLILCRTEMYG